MSGSRYLSAIAFAVIVGSLTLMQGTAGASITLWRSGASQVAGESPGEDDHLTRQILNATLPGDFNRDGHLNAPDVNALIDQIASGSGEEVFDLSGDGLLDQQDLLAWVRDLRRTWPGDANLDGWFSSEDLVVVLQAGEYEDHRFGRARWETGDWTGDGRFDSGDFVFALQQGGYEWGPREADGTELAVAAEVPEPGGLAILALMTICCLGNALAGRLFS